MTSRTFSVPAITCDHCRQAIETELGRVPGADSVEVKVAEKTVTVEGKAPEETIRQAINDAGYDEVALL